MRLRGEVGAVPAGTDHIEVNVDEDASTRDEVVF
jgi:hypothetical protein